MTIEEFIRRLGGREAVARKLHLTRQAVHQWTVRGRIPWRHHLPLQKEAAEVGVELTMDEIANMRSGRGEADA